MNNTRWSLWFLWGDLHLPSIWPDHKASVSDANKTSHSRAISATRIL